MKMRHLIVIAAAVALAIFGFLFWNGPHAVHGSGQGIVVLCSSCTYSGLAQTGHLVLMDGNTGEVWIYTDAAMEGKENPIHWGKLVLGQKLVRVTP
jgi:hypothetical protein